MSISSKIFFISLLFFILFYACSNVPSSNSGNSSIKFKVAIKNLASPRALAETSVNITPSLYKIAFTYFALSNKNGVITELINTADTNPSIIDFTSSDMSKTLLEGISLSNGTYSGYIMRFIYLEMDYPANFHVPVGFTNEVSAKFTNLNYKFRLYFNAVDPYWKRDFVVQDPTDTNTWYWLRREIDNSHSNFFIKVTNNGHPVGGAGPDNTIDLFDDPSFWGDQSTYSNSSFPITITSGQTTGGVDASINEFTIKSDSTIILEIDVTNTMNFWEDLTSAPTGITFTDNVLDLGPGYTPSGSTNQNYGDKGLHPFLPKFKLKTE